MVAEKTESMSWLLNEAASFGVRSGFEENDSIRGGVVKLTFVIEIVDEFAVRPVARDVAVVWKQSIYSNAGLQYPLV